VAHGALIFICVHFSSNYIPKTHAHTVVIIYPPELQVHGTMIRHAKSLEILHSRLIDELLNHGRAFPALSFYFLGRTNLRCGLEELARLKISRFSSSASGEIVFRHDSKRLSIPNTRTRPCKL